MHDAIWSVIVDKGLCIVLTLMTGAALFAVEACSNETERPPITDQLGNNPEPGVSGGGSPVTGAGQPSGGNNGGDDSDTNPNGSIPPAGTTPTQPGAGTGATTSTGGLGTTSTGGLGTSSGSTSGTSGTGTSGSASGGTTSGVVGTSSGSTGTTGTSGGTGTTTSSSGF